MRSLPSGKGAHLRVAKLILYSSCGRCRWASLLKRNETKRQVAQISIINPDVPILSARGDQPSRDPGASDLVPTRTVTPAIQAKSFFKKYQRCPPTIWSSSAN